jgi:hypothetical protein
MLKKISVLANLVMVAFATNAQQVNEKPKVAFSGGLDGYYRTDFTSNKYGTNNGTSFTGTKNSFELGMATVKADISAAKEKAAATIDLGFGGRAEEFSYNDAGSRAYIKQAFVTYAATDKLKFTFGKFATHVGYELVDAQANRNYSMSYMFTNGPFFHTGVKADITSGDWGFMAGIADFVDNTSNGTTAGSRDINNLIAQVSKSFNEGKVKAYLNYSGFFGAADVGVGGVEAVHQVDAVVTATISSKFNVAYNITNQSIKTLGNSAQSWLGNAVYLNFDPKDNFGLTARAEIISDSKKIKYGAAENIFATTVSANVKRGALTFIPELRFESSKNAIYTKGSGAANKSAFSAVFAAVYKF